MTRVGLDEQKVVSTMVAKLAKIKMWDRSLVKCYKAQEFAGELK